MSTEHKVVKLQARDLEDLSVVSTILQDALVPLSDIQYVAPEETFMMVLNRFCWEDVSPDSKETPYRRVLAGIRFAKVKAVAYRGIDRDNQDQAMELLTIAYCDEAAPDCHIVLHFAGGGAIRLTVDSLACAMEDLCDAWPTAWKPEHTGE